MIRRRIASNLISIFFGLTFIQCSGVKEPKADDTLGTFQKRLYTNSYFGFNLSIPDKWEIIQGQDFKKLPDSYDSLARIKVDSYDKNKKEFEYLFVLKKSPADTLFSYIIFMTEPLSEWRKKGVTNAQEYLEYTERFINKDHPGKYPLYEFSPIKTQSTIGGEDFLTRALFIWVDKEQKHNRITYCKQIKDYLLLVSIDGFHRKSELAEAKELLRTIKWLK